MSDLLQDLRYALRLLVRAPAFSVTAVLVLALGIGANTSIFSIVHAVLLRPLPYQEPERLVMLWERIVNFGKGNTEIAQADFLDFREENRVFENLAAVENRSFNLSGAGEPVRIRGARVSASLFPTLGVQALHGRTFTEEEDHAGRDRVAVLSYGLWQRRFGSDAGLVSAKIHLDGQPYVVLGVMPRDFQFPIGGMSRLYAAELWVPIAFTDKELQDRGNTFNTSVVARLKPGVTLAQAAREVSAIAKRIHDKYPVRVQKMFQLDATVTGLHEEVVGNVRTALLVLLAAVTFVLLIGCANIANLLLARAAARQREFAIRAALGAGKRRLLRQLLTESLLLSLLGGAAGLLIAMWGADLLVSVSPANIPRLRQARVDRWVTAFTFLISLATGVVFGLMPALEAARTQIGATLKEGGRGLSASFRRSRTRSLLVVSEVALSLVLVAGAGLLIKSFARLRQANLGFETQNVLTMSVALPESRYSSNTAVSGFYQTVIDRMQALPGVRSAAAATSVPMAGGWWTIMFTPENRMSAVWERTLALNTIVTPDYFRVLGIPLRGGRYFTVDDKPGALESVIISETLAKHYWPGQDPVGKRLKWGSPQSTDPWFTIVGVVGDARQKGLDQAIEPAVYMPFAQRAAALNNIPRSLILAVRTAGEPGALTETVRRQIASLDPELPVFAIRTMDDVIRGSVAPRRFQMLLLGAFAGVALLLAAVGLYGVMSYTVGQHTQEIGVRVALGASPADVVRLVLGQGMRLAAIGLIIGLFASMALARAIASLLVDVSPGDPSVLTSVSLLLAAVSALACYLAARRATRVDPVVALRHE